MTDDDDPDPYCVKDGCAIDADFWLYQREENEWLPICRSHLVHLYPSIELKVWLESGYAKPIELETPSSPPDPPVTKRQKEFRDIIEETI